MNLRQASAADYYFIEDLFVKNMIGYYKRHRLPFSKYAFALQCDRTANSIIEHNGQDAGFLRLDERDGGLHICDLQIISSLQGSGVGSSVLEYVHNLAEAMGLPHTSLFVFPDNRAANLYFRHGYRNLGQGDPPLKKMIRVLNG